MPSQIAHILAGEGMLEALAPARRPGMSGEDLAWFRLGCQGPDLFYHNQRTRPSALHFGALAHKRDFGLLMEGLALALGEHNLAGAGPCSAFFLGFATHATVDRALHPYIVYFSGWFDPKRPETAELRSTHPFLERLIDLALLERRGRTRASIDHGALFPLSQLEEASPVVAQLETVLEAGLKHAYPLSASTDPRLGERLRNTFLDAAFFYRATDPAREDTGLAEWVGRLDEAQGAGSMGLLYPPKLPSGLDVGNAQGRTWAHPAGDGRESREGIEDLLGQAVAEGAPALSALVDCLGGSRPIAGLGDLFGRGSLSINDPEGRPAIPRLCAPLALKPLMVEEFRRRKASLG